MAPEQMRGEAVDGRADQFSWAVLAYELLSGRSRGTERRIFIVISQILTRDAPPASSDRSRRSAARRSRDHAGAREEPGGPFPSMDESSGFSIRSLGHRPSSLPRTAVESLGSAATVQSTKTSLVGRCLACSDALSGDRETSRLVVPALWPWRSPWRASPGSRAAASPRRAPDAAAPAATSLLDLPLPSTTADALAAYKDGMWELRRGDNRRSPFRVHARLELDPFLLPLSFALRGELLTDGANGRAGALSESLAGSLVPVAARPGQLLEAYEPLFQQEPS